MFIRTKRVSDPLDDMAKARLRGDGYCYLPMTAGYTSSSGSEHDADILFPGLIHDFLQINSSFPSDNALINESDNEDIGDSDNYVSDDAKTVHDLLDPSRRSEPFLVRLHADVVRVEEASEGLRSSRPAYLRAVMMRLREAGYNAGLCKARWESGGSLTAGSYEYIDVIETERYIVDVEFAAEFAVARATKEYSNLLAVLPRVMVGRSEEVRQVVRMMAEAVKRSMKSKELHVPPWRKRRYMLAKWLGPYRRTVNAMQSSSTVPLRAAGGDTVKCVAVGFGNVMETIAPPATSTR